MNAISKENFDGIKNIAGVVILYNPQKDVIQNIESYINQINFLYVIDNSEKRTSFVSDFYQKNPNVEYIFNNCNIGVAEALNIAAGKTISDGYKFLLTMDQDSKASPRLVESLYNIIITADDIGIVSPVHSNKFKTHNKPANGIQKVMSVMTSGNLLSLKTFKKTGQFLEDFFIDYVDIEYCIRLNYNGYKVFILNSAVLEHSEANISEKKIFSKKYYPTNNHPFRIYYKTRNLLCMRKLYKNKFSHALSPEYNAYFRNIAKIFLFENQKILKVKMIFLGIRDFLKEKKGKRF